jgi:hypothetical protein
VGERVRIDTTRIEVREIEGELIMLDLERHVYVRANRTATILWSLLEGGASRAELVAKLTADAQVDRARAEKDTDEFIADLRDRKLLVAED